jgi:hypothetical protein
MKQIEIRSFDEIVEGLISRFEGAHGDIFCSLLKYAHNNAGKIINIGGNEIDSLGHVYYIDKETDFFIPSYFVEKEL